VSRTLLEAVAKVILFSKDATGLKLDLAEFDEGVYRINLSGVVLPDKPFVNDIVDEHVLCKDLVESDYEKRVRLGIVRVDDL